MRILTFLITLTILLPTRAQILTVTPTFPTVDDEVTIIYDASQGNAALVGVSPIYAHMGVITDLSTTPSDWQYVQGNWGTDDPSVLMTDLGNDMHQITIDMDVFYGFPAGTDVQQMSFVFRNEDGSVVGRDSDGADIFYEVVPVGSFLQVAILDPSTDQVVDVGDQLVISGSTNIDAEMELYDNGNLIASVSGSTVLEHTIDIAGSGTHEVVLNATSGSLMSSDTVSYVINGEVNVEDPPAGLHCGVNHNSATSVTILLHAPGKDFIYLIGDHSNWQADPQYFMNRSVDGSQWWITLNDLTAGQRYAYQFWIDGMSKLADPCSELILDPWNDPQIDAITYPNPHPYPSGLTNGNATLFETNPQPFAWQYDDYERPSKDRMVIYELLVRDFIETHNYLTLIDTLPYLENLGINAIELMPPLEFEGNNSWGYNPSFHMALDKYYGTPEHFKMFVDACHQRGIAVIVDMVLNHAFGQSPHAQMYWDAANNAPSADNPWLNPVCPHEPFCWGSDYDHEAQPTQDYVDRVNTHWLEEYHVDGFRFDFTGGMHNGSSGGFSNNRIQIVQRMADVVWSVDPEAYVILEHWCDNAEEEILSNYGCLLWGNVTFNYQEAAMGYLSGSNFEWGIYQQRGWADPHLVTYAESHDEERVTYKTYEFGNSSGTYDTQEMLTGMARNELNAVFLLSQPGPKMIWQFGELGYDVSIDFDCRVCPKPILWNYFEDNWRKKVYDVYAAMNNLRQEHESFHTENFAHSLAGAFKRINLYHPDMDVVIIGNFDVVAQSGVPNFPYTGTWYDYFGGFSIQEDDLSNEFLLQPGEYRVYTSQPLDQPDIQVGLEDFSELDLDVELSPNPSSDELNVKFEIQKEALLEFIVYDLNGKEVSRIAEVKQKEGRVYQTIELSSLDAGEYWLLIAIDGRPKALPFIKH